MKETVAFSARNCKPRASGSQPCVVELNQENVLEQRNTKFEVCIEMSSHQTGKAVIAMIAGFGAGAWYSYLATKKSFVFREAACWPSVRGRILESITYKDPSKGNKTHFRVRYEYVVGERLEGDTPRLCGDWFWNNKQQAAFVARYSPGKEVEVYYDGRDPKRSCLDRTDRSGITAMWVIAVGGFTLACLLLWLVAGDWGLLER